MKAVRMHLTAMKVKELAEELEARHAVKSGRKRALQLRLRALVVSAAAAAGDGEVPLADSSDDE